MSYFKVLDDIAEKYNMESTDKQWIKIIFEEEIKCTEYIEELEKQNERYKKVLNKVYKKLDEIEKKHKIYEPKNYSHCECIYERR